MPFTMIAIRHKSTWLWLGGAAVLWALIPMLVGAWLAASDAPGYQLVGTSVLNPTDAVVYQSYIEQSRTGSWWMNNWFTSEVTSPTLWQPHWWAVGRLAEWTHISSGTAYIMTRLIGTVVLVLALGWTVKWLFPSPRTQNLAWALALFGGGLGWLWALLVQPQHVVTSAPDFWVAEMYPALSLITSPHFLFVTAGFLCTLVGVERYALAGRVKFVWFAMASGVATVAMHPFHIVTWIAIWLALTVWRRWLGQSVREYVRGWVAVVCVCAPLVLLYGLQTLTDDMIQARASQNIAPTWHWALTIVALGGFGIATVWSRRGQWGNLVVWQWLIVWAVVGTVIIFLPFPFQRRLSQGLIIPFIFLSLPVLEGLLSRLRPPPIRKVGMALGILMLCASSLTSLVLVMKGYRDEIRVANAYNFYVSPEQQHLHAILRQDPDPNHAVLGAVTTSQFIPSASAHRVFIGHSVETLRFNQKLEQLRAFYAQMGWGGQREFLASHQICWVIDGPRERAYGQAFQPAVWPDLRLAWRGPTMALYAWEACL